MKAGRAWQLWLWGEVGGQVIALSAEAPHPLGAGGQLRVTAADRLELAVSPGARVFLNDVQLAGTAELRGGDLLRADDVQAVVLMRSPAPPTTRAARWTRAELDARLEEEVARAVRPGSRAQVAYALVHSGRDEQPALAPALHALWPGWAFSPVGEAASCGVTLGGSAELAALRDACAEAPAAALGVGLLPDDGFDADELREAALERLTGGSSARWPEEPIALDPAMVRLAGWVDRNVRPERPVVFEGEPGSGRTLWARRLHARTGRRSNGVCAVDCRRGLAAARRALAAAKGAGAALLGNLDALEASDAAALLEESTRFGAVLATARETPAALRGQVSVAPVPALRDRPTEVLPLAAHALEQARRWLGRRNLSLGGEARRALAERRWPGNVRELRNAVWLAALAAESDELRAENLPPAPDARLAGEAAPRDEDFRAALRATEKNVLLGALSRTRWNVTQAARELGLPRRTVVYRMSRLGLRRPG